MAVVPGVGHQDFRAVVELRNAPRRSEEDHGEARLADVVTQLGVDPAHVVVVGKDDVLERVGVEEIVAQHLVQPDPVGMPAFLFVQALHEGVVEGEVQQARQAGGIPVGILLALLPIGEDGGVEAPFLAADVEVGIGLAHGTGPARHEFGVGIGVGVHPDATEPEVFDPPDGVLYEVIGQQGLALVQVGHGLDEPAVGEAPAVRLAHVGIAQGRAPVGGGGEGATVVDPVLGGQVVHPRVLGPAVVHDHVHDELEAVFAGGIGEPEIFLVGAEARIDPVVIGGGVAVIGPLRLVVLEQRIEPDGGVAHVGEVVEVVRDAGQVAAVPSMVVFAVWSLQHPLDGIITGIAIGETVRRDQADGVAAIVARDLPPGPFAQRKGSAADGLAIALLLQPVQFDFTGFRPLFDAEVDEGIVGAVPVGDPADGDAGVVDLHLKTGQVVAMDHQLDPFLGHVHPPERGVNAVDKGLAKDRLTGKPEGANGQEGMTVPHARKETAEPVQASGEFTPSRVPGQSMTQRTDPPALSVTLLPR